MKTKVKAEHVVKFDLYTYLSDCVDRGIEYGYKKAHKHTDKPTEVEIKEMVHLAIMNNICELIRFENVDE